MTSFWVLTTGALWRDLPERYGLCTADNDRFNRWAKAGVRDRVFMRLAEESPDSTVH